MTALYKEISSRHHFCPPSSRFCSGSQKYVARDIPKRTAHACAFQVNDKF